MLEHPRLTIGQDIFSRLVLRIDEPLCMLSVHTARGAECVALEPAHAAGVSVGYFVRCRALHVVRELPVRPRVRLELLVPGIAVEVIKK